MTSKDKKPLESRVGGKKGRRIPNKLLFDMRKVYSQPKTDDKGQGQKACRLLLVEDPKAFLSQLAAMERSHQVSVDKRRSEALVRGGLVVDEAGAVETDNGRDRVVDLIDELLGEWEDGRQQARVSDA
jgi:hypothetical protein